MALSIDQIKRGSRVCIAFDDEGNPLKVKRFGVIVRVDTVKTWKNVNGKRVPDQTMPNGNPRAGISKIWVALKEGEPPVEVKNQWLALVREGRRSDWLKLKAVDDIQRAEEIESGKSEPAEFETLEIDQTGVDHKGPVTEAELDRLTK